MEGVSRSDGVTVDGGAPSRPPQSRIYLIYPVGGPNYYHLNTSSHQIISLKQMLLASHNYSKRHQTDACKDSQRVQST